MRYTAQDIKIWQNDLVYSGFFKIRRYQLQYKRFDGQWSHKVTREVFERTNAVAVLPYDPVRNEVVLIEEFRIGALQDQRGPWLHQIVAGVIEGDESVEMVAKREMLEECGCEVQKLIKIADFYTSPGGSSEFVTLYCSIVDSTTAKKTAGVTSEGEDILVHVLPVSEAIQWLHEGRINNAATVIALQWLSLELEQALKAGVG